MVLSESMVFMRQGIRGAMFMNREEFLQAVIHQYLNSGDFNGLVLSDLSDPYFVSGLESLLRDRLIDIIGDSDDDNPHVKRYEPPEVGSQIENLQKRRLGPGPCVYPTANALKLSGVSYDADNPYTSAIRQGAPLLNYRAFAMTMLESYQTSDEHVCEVDKEGGTIWCNLDDPEPCDIEFAVGIDGQRCVVAHLLRLSSLSPGQQQTWRKYEIPVVFLSPSSRESHKVIGW